MKRIFLGLIALPLLAQTYAQSPGWILNTIYLEGDCVMGAGNKCATIMAAPRTGNIHKIAFCVAALTTAQTLSVSVQTVDANGLPSGTLIGGAGTQAAPAASTCYTPTLSADAAVTKADNIAVVIAWSSTEGALNLRQVYSSTQFPGKATYASSTWTKGKGPLSIGLEYDDGTYSYQGFGPCVTALVSSTSTIRVANRLYLPFPAKVHGLRLYAYDWGGFTATIWDSSWNVVASKAVPAKLLTSATGSDMADIVFAAPVTLAANTVYYYGHVNAISGADGTCSSAAALKTLFGGSTDYEVTKDGASAQVDHTTVRSYIMPIFDSFVAGSTVSY
jgi:hypothetical protein